MNSEELKKLREEFENLKSTPSILDIDESTLNEFRIKGDGNIFKRFMDAINRDKITPSNEKIKEIENKEKENKEKENKEIKNKEIKNNEIEKEIKNNEKSNIKINNKEKEINDKEINNKEKEINDKEINNNKEINKNDENTVKDNKIDFKSIEKYSSSPKDVKMSDFESPPPKTKEVKPVISPATFKTNQKQTRELVSTGKLKDTDLNKYSRSSTYTADDGKTQVDRSTVNTIAKFDMGPNIKKGEKLGVISGSMRKKYDMKASSFKPEAYDVVLDYVLSEGHADTVEEAHYVMMQMDEETIRSINELALGTAAGVAGVLTLGAMGLDAIRKMNKNKQKMEKGEEFTKGSTLDNIQKKNQMYKDFGITKP